MNQIPTHQTEVIARELKRFMLEHGLSQSDLARRAGISQSVISRILARDIRTDVRSRTIRKLAQALGIPPALLAPSMRPETENSLKNENALPHNPIYTDENSRELAEALKDAHDRHEELTAAGRDTDPVLNEILQLKRRIREGGQLKPGDFLKEGRFRLLERLGQGGFSSIFKAYDRQERQPVAVKVLHSQHAEDRSRRERFFRGARKMRQLQHQSIVRMVEPKLEDGGYFFFVMELVQGGDLRQAVQERQITGLTILRQVAEALDFAHKSGVVHRDVKPSNILLTTEGRAKLTDFDLVRAFDTTGGTRTGSMLGTFLYMAPEAMYQSNDVGAAADIYSLAMTAAYVLYGRELPPTVLRDPAAFISPLHATPAVKRILTRAASWEPKARPSLKELIDLLNQEEKNPVRSGPEGASRSDIEDALVEEEDWQKRRDLYAKVVKQIGDPTKALQLLDRRRRWTCNGNDLYFIERTAESVAEKWPESRRQVDQLRACLYDHIPLPPRESFRWIESRDGRVKLWRKIPTGKLWMGSKDERYGEGRPLHDVAIKTPFRIAAVPVTIAQYEAFDPEHRSHSQSEAPNEQLDMHPVEQVTWFEASAFCRWLSSWLPGAHGARLPTEEEWEYSCRAGTQTSYWMGDEEEDLKSIGWFRDNSGTRSHEVGSKPANPWGLYDVHGNVWEWTLSEWTEDYSSHQDGEEIDSLVITPTTSTNSERVYRGGSFIEKAKFARSAYRSNQQPEAAFFDRGFRVLLPSA